MRKTNREMNRTNAIRARTVALYAKVQGIERLFRRRMTPHQRRLLRGVKSLLVAVNQDERSFHALLRNLG